MSARTNREAARARIGALFSAALDQMIPAEASAPLKGATFLDFEEQVERLARSVLPVILEERAALAPNAVVEVGGRCPFCGSERVFLEKRITQTEVCSPHGPVVVGKQQARCRACGRSFSPSDARLGLADGGTSDTGGGATGGPRSRPADVR